ncbi:MAG: ABC transporter substrate-binding protein, partial [Anaerolineae bacterium]|nr:ABC transporter substrate-binding protein [Anaerolineae bacterium]
LNPFLENDAALRELVPLIYSSLLRADPASAELRPWLAEEWAFSDDGRQVTFRLPPDRRWSNGNALNASSISASLQATGHPALQAFEAITALNETTLVFEFEAINCSALTRLSLLPLIPAEEIGLERPSASGPFVVNDWPENHRSLSAVRNPHYPAGSATLGGLNIRFLREREIEIALSEGRFDLVGPLKAPLNLEVPARFTDLTYPAGEMVYVAINYEPKNEDPLPQPVHEALIAALDRETILSQALADDGQLLAGSLLPQHWGANESLALPAYDPNAARARLIQAGLRDQDGDGWLDQGSERLELSIRLNGFEPLNQDLGWLISGYYRELGIFARAEGVGFDSVVDDLFTHDFQLALFSWPMLPDPDQQLYWRSTENTEGFGLNFTSYQNGSLDDLFDRANTVPGCNPRNRAEVYAEIQAVLAQDRPVDFLLAPNQHLLVTNRLKAVQPGPFAPLTWNAEEWEIGN